jgi:hypothetical protein
MAPSKKICRDKKDERCAGLIRLAQFSRERSKAYPLRVEDDPARAARM